MQRFMMQGCLAVTIGMLAGPAQAKIPFLNATCPGGIEVHADEGGPIYISGKEATLQRFNENYYEARLNGITVSLSIRPDGSPDISYTGRGRANGTCQIKAAP